MNARWNAVLGLIARRLCAGGHGRLPQLIGDKRHADVGREIAGAGCELLLNLPRQRRARHVAEPRKLRQRPRARRLVEKRP